MFVGIDGCRSGWFAVSLDEAGAWDTQVYETIPDLWQAQSHASLLLIDIPIGLREENAEERLCDLEARKLLGRPRGSSVFPAPCRAALRACSHAAASRANQERTGRRLSCQSWNIARKIREVDDLLEHEKAFREMIREVHPEVCFWALADSRSMQHSKKRRQGFEERLAVLRRVYPLAQQVVTHALKTWRRCDVARDDVLDALVAAVTGYLGQDKLRTVPETPEIDSRGLPMQMVYWLASCAH